MKIVSDCGLQPFKEQKIRGGMFHTQWIQDHFDAEDWYSPLPKGKDPQLTALDQRNVAVILKQFPEHIAVRRPREIRRLLESEGWRVRSLQYSTAPFPVLRWLERGLSRLPVVGALFRYRILLRASPPAAIH